MGRGAALDTFAVVRLQFIQTRFRRRSRLDNDLSSVRGLDKPQIPVSRKRGTRRSIHSERGDLPLNRVQRSLSTLPDSIRVALNSIDSIPSDLFPARELDVSRRQDN